MTLDSELTFFILLALSFPLMAIAALIIAIRARNRVVALQERLGRLELSHARLQNGLPPTGETPAVAPTPFQADPLKGPQELPTTATTIVSTPAATAPPPPAAAPGAGSTDIGTTGAGLVSGPAAIAPSPASARAAPGADRKQGSLEEKLGARWSVWVGVLALAIGGLMLVRFSIEEGYFGPAARVALGLALGLGLVGAGEWLRRRDVRAGRPRSGDERPFATPGVPAALTAAGAATVFGSVYAAYALYGFIGPAAAFVVLGLVAVLTMFSAALQGPALAAFGLPAALAAPLLVASNQPQLWPLTLYLAAVVTSAYGLARLRRWRWLAISSAAGAWLWGLALLSSGHDEPLAVAVHILIQTLLAAAVLALQPYWSTPDREARLDRVALVVLAAFAVLGVGCFDLPLGVTGRMVTAGLLAGMLFVVGRRIAPVAAATLLAGGVTAGALWHWRVVQLALAEPQTLAPGGVGAHPMPESLTLYLGFAIVAGFLIAAGALQRLLGGRELPLPAAASYAAAATLSPLGVLTVVWMKLANFGASIPFAIVAALLALAGVAIVARLRAGQNASADNHRLATGAVAAAAVAAIALGLTFALDRGMLTVAFALMAPGAAWVAIRLDLPALRHAVGAIGALVLGRLIWNPAIAAEGAIGATPVFNWLLWGYGIPAASFAGAAWLLARHRRDRITALCESLAIIFTSLLVLFEIRHALNNGDPFRVSSSHLEAGLIATCALLFSMALSRMNLRRADPVYRIASLLLSLATMAIIVIGLFVLANPLFGSDPVIGGAVFNSLIPAYLLPAVVAGCLAMANRATWPRWRTLATAVLALLLLTGYAILAIRRYFQGPDLAIWRGAGDAEWLCYTAALLAIGVVLLTWGLLKRQRLVRLASALFIVAAVLKAFLSDMGNLDGVWRALSFIGLGLVLIGVARAYQLLLYPASSPEAGSASEPESRNDA